MAFKDSPRFPDDIAYGAIGGAGFSTDLVAVRAGHESRNSNWTRARCRFEVSHAAKNPTQLAALIRFFRSVKGRAIAFRFKDFTDWRHNDAGGTGGLVGVVAGDPIATFGVGYGVPVYQAFKRYTDGSFTDDRLIAKLVSGRVTIKRGGVAVAVGVGASEIALDINTGLVTFVADASRTVTGVTVGATTVVSVSGSTMVQIGVGDRLYLSDLAGADAALLNDLSHVVTNVAGLDYTLSTSTAGKTITTGSGVARAFPQADETLTWEGEFDVPVRFDTDQMMLSADTRSGGSLISSWGGVPLVEVRDIA